MKHLIAVIAVTTVSFSFAYIVFIAFVSSIMMRRVKNKVICKKSCVERNTFLRTNKGTEDERT